MNLAIPVRCSTTYEAWYAEGHFQNGTLAQQGLHFWSLASHLGSPICPLWQALILLSNARLHCLVRVGIVYLFCGISFECSHLGSHCIL